MKDVCPACSQAKDRAEEIEQLKEELAAKWHPEFGTEWREISARAEKAEKQVQELKVVLGRASELLDCWGKRLNYYPCSSETLCPTCLVYMDARELLFGPGKK